jgi:hypothetical protein
MAARGSPPAPAEKPGPVHQPFQQAHEAYVKALDETWNQVQRQCVNDHLEFQQRLTKLSRATTPDEFKEAQESVHQMMAPPSADPSLGKAAGEAFTQYKTAIKAALSESNLADLDPTALSAIGQSLYMVGQMAHHATLLAPAAKPS